MSSIKNKIICFFTFIGGFYFLLEYILPDKFTVFERSIEFGKYHGQITQGIIVLGIMTIGLGIINIFMTHGGIVLRGRKNWFNSLTLILSFLITAFIISTDFISSESRSNQVAEIANQELFITKILDDAVAIPNKEPIPRLEKLKEFLQQKQVEYAGNQEVAQQIDVAISETEFLIREISDTVDLPITGNENIQWQKNILISKIKQLSQLVFAITTVEYETSGSKRGYEFINNSLFIPLGAAMFSLLAFYVVTSAYNSFRIRSLEALAIMIPAILIMLGQIPHGPAYIYDGLPDIRTWLLKYLSSPAFRAIFFGSAIAGLVMAIRMWLSLERSPMVDEEKGE